jgi:hypothetical protein
MLANEFGDRIGAALRQVQFWTDQGILKCVPETKHQGRGRKRLYDPIELPIGALVVVLSRFGFTVGVLDGYAHIVRQFLAERQPESLYRQRPRSWFRAAFRGVIESWMVFVPETTSERIPGERDKPADKRVVFSWESTEQLVKLLPTRRAATVVNVCEVISPLVR